MSRQGSQLSRLTVPASSKLAAYLHSDKSLEALQSKVIVPRVKLIQGTTKSEVKKQYGAGSAVLIAGQVTLAKLDETFYFNPLFFWEEWAKWKDREDKDEATPMILERSYSSTSPIAKKAAHKDHRWELYPGQEKVDPEKQLWYRYVHHFCFAGFVYSEGEAHLTRVVLSFEKGEWSTGRKFCSDAAMRKIGVSQDDGSIKYVPQPLYTQVWGMTPREKTWKGKQWFGFEVSAPPEELRMIRDEDLELCHSKHEELFAAFEKKLLEVEGMDDTEADPDDDEGGEGSGEM